MLSLASFLRNQVMQISALLVWAEESNRNFAAGADLTLEAFADLYQGEVGAEMSAQFRYAQTGGVETRCAMAAVVVIVGDVFQ